MSQFPEKIHFRGKPETNKKVKEYADYFDVNDSEMKRQIFEKGMEFMTEWMKFVTQVKKGWFFYPVIPKSNDFLTPPKSVKKLYTFRGLNKFFPRKARAYGFSFLLPSMCDNK